MTLIFYPFLSGMFHFEVHSASGVAYLDFTKLAKWLPQPIFILVLKSGHMIKPDNGIFSSSMCSPTFGSETPGTSPATMNLKMC